MYRFLHICNNYSGSLVHRAIVEGQEPYGINSIVFCAVSTLESRINPKDNEHIVKCVSAFDRFLFFHKQKKMFLALNKVIPDYKNSNCIHAHSIFSDGNIAYKIKKDEGIPYILSVSGTDINHFFPYRPLLRKLGEKIMLESECIIVPSETYRQILIEKYTDIDMRDQINNKIRIIPFGIDSFWFSNIIDKKFRHDDKIRIIYVGEIRKNKNLEIIIQSMSKLEKKGYQSQLTIVGEVIDKQEYKKLVGIKGVIFAGKKNKDELLDYYRQNDIFVMISHSETFGLVYAEAMSQGLPILYTRGQGFDKQFPEGKVGFSISDFDALELSNRIIDIYQNYDYYSINCVSSVNKFRWDVISETYNKIYCEATLSNNNYMR